MSDLTIGYNEEMVGAGHPTKSDTLNRLALVEHNSDGTHKFALSGFKTGLLAGYSDTDELTFSGGSIEVGGSTYTLGAATTVTFSGLGASQSRWIYVAAPSSGTALSASEFSSSTTTPTWSAAKGGWYNGDDRAVFVLITNASSQFVNFRCNGRLVLYDNPILDADSITPSTTWTDVTLSVPVLDGLVAVITAFSRYSNANATSYVRTNGSSAVTGQRLGYVTANLAERHHSHVRVVVDSAAKVEVKFQTATSNLISVYADGFELMEGM